jgi:hypothetical protein
VDHQVSLIDMTAVNVSSRTSTAEEGGGGTVRVAACGSIVCCVLEAAAVTLDGDFTERERERERREVSDYIHKSLEA